MLKVEMIIDNLIAWGDTPEQFIKQKVLNNSNSALYTLIDIRVVQGDGLKITPDTNDADVLLSEAADYFKARQIEHDDICTHEIELLNKIININKMELL